MTPKETKIKEIDIYDVNHKKIGKIGILIGGIGNPNPKSFMDEQVLKYTKNCLYNEFIESHLDMPWVRIILKGINDLDYQKFSNQLLDEPDRSNN